MERIKIVCVSCILLCHTFTVTGQIFFTEAHSRWNDRFDEWEVVGVVKEEEVVINLELVWPLQPNWEEWRIDSEIFQGTIRTKWPGDPSQWEVRLNGAIYLVTQLTRNDVNRWEIRDGSNREILQTQWYNNPNQWYFPRKRDQWVIFMDRENDPRDWIIEDFLEESTDPGIRLAAIFIVIWQTIPK